MKRAHSSNSTPASLSAALARFGALMGAQGDATGLLHVLDSIDPAAFGVNRISILLYNPASGGLESSSAALNSPAVSGVWSATTQPISVSISGQCFLEGKPVIENDCGKTTLIPRRFVEELNLKSAMCVPIKCDRGTLGIIRADDTEHTHRFTDADVEFFLCVARVIADALVRINWTSRFPAARKTPQPDVVHTALLSDPENGGHAASPEGSAMSQKSWDCMAALAMRLVEADTSIALARALRGATLELFGWDAFLFSERVGDSEDFLRVLGTDLFDGERRDIDDAVSPPIPYQTRPELHRGETLLIHRDQLTEQQLATQGLRRFGNRERLSASLMYAPVLFGGRLYGIISTQSYTPRKWSRMDLALLESVARLAAPALRRVMAERELQARLADFRRANEQIGRANQRLAAIYRIADSVRRARNLEEVFPLVHDAVREILPTENFYIALHNGKRQCLTFPYASDENGPYARPEMAPAKNLLWLVIRSRSPILTNTEGFAELAARGLVDPPQGRAAKSWLGVPLVLKDRIIGAMVVLSFTDEKAYGEDALSVMTFLSGEVAGAIAHREAEDRRIAREERYRRAIAQAGAVPYERDFQTGAWIYMGDGIAELTGYSQAELTPELWKRLQRKEIMTGELAGMPVAVAADKMRAGEVRAWRAEYLIVTREGKEKWLADSSIAIRGPDGKPTASLGMLQDITAAKRAAHVAEVLSRLAHRLSFATSVVDAGGMIADAADELIGWDACFFDLYDSSTGRIREMLNMDTIEGEKIVVTGHNPEGVPSASERRMLREGAFLLHRDPLRSAPEGEKFQPFGDEARPSLSMLFVPARRGDEIVAFCSIQSYTPNAYSKEQLSLFQVLADHCAGALHRIRLEEAVRTSEQRYALAALGSSDGLWDWDIAAKRAYFSPRWKEILGFDEAGIGDQIDEWLNRIVAEDRAAFRERLDDHLAGRTDHVQHEHRVVRRDGTTCWVLARGVAIRDARGNPLRMAGSLKDIAQRKEYEAQLVHSAFYDSLTGLANRSLFTDRLGRAFQRSRRNPEHTFAVMFFDLDRFKAVNDTYGHPVGDKLLRAIAERLQNYFRSTDTFARMGGDEFTVLLDEVHSVRDALIAAERVIRDFETPFHIDGHKIVAGTSIGIAISNAGYENEDAIMRDADTALYRAKERGRGRIEVFDQAMRTSAAAQVETESALREGIERSEFEVYYQPVLDVQEARTVGFEALLRWNHPTRGMLGPADFLDVAEESSLIIPLGTWGLRTACRQAAAWRSKFESARNCYLSVNLSRRQLSSPGLVDSITAALQESGLPGEALHVELEEAVFSHGIAPVQPVIAGLRALGVKIVLDNFGAKAASLAQLDRYPIDYLKIDRVFVSGLSDDPASHRIARAMLDLARVLNLRVVAEGTETAQQLEALRTLQCDFVQGYYLAPPCSAAEFERLLQA